MTKREEIAEVDVETPLGEKKEAAEDNAKKWLEREFGGFVPHCWCDLRRRRVVAPGDKLGESYLGYFSTIKLSVKEVKERNARGNRAGSQSFSATSSPALSKTLVPR